MQIKTDRLFIRPIMEADWPDIQRIWADFGSSEYAKYDFPFPTENEAVHAQVLQWLEQADEAGRLFFAVCLDGRLIGYAVFHRDGESLDCGYTFHSAYHRRGYAKEALRALLEALRGRGFQRFTAGTALANTPSCSLLRSLGFHLTGTEQVSFYTDAMGKPIFFEGGLFVWLPDGQPQ